MLGHIFWYFHREITPRNVGTSDRPLSQALQATETHMIQKELPQWMSQSDRISPGLARECLSIGGDTKLVTPQEEKLHFFKELAFFLAHVCRCSFAVVTSFEMILD